MANLNSVLNEKISRIARHEIRVMVSSTKRFAVQHRRDIAALKRFSKESMRRLAAMEKISVKAVTQTPTETPDNVRYSPRTVLALRRKLGLSGVDFGRLVGVSALTIYSWESRKSRPRAKQLAKLVSLRGIGVREALKRLELLGGSAPKKTRRQGAYAQTAVEFIGSLVKGGKAMSTAAINAAWKKAGRPGRANNTLGVMVRAKKLKRVKVKGERGSKYVAGSSR
jgi:DNA-binding transcriptional regulator YiaG